MLGLFQNGIIPFPLLLLLTAVFAYFCGCFNGAVIVSKYILRDDVRNHGSGNAGLTNFFRTFGGPLTLVVILCDVLKAVIALLVGQWLFRHGYTDFISSKQLLFPPDHLIDPVDTLADLCEVLERTFLPAGSRVPVYVSFQGRQGHSFRRYYRYYDRLAGSDCSLGRLFAADAANTLCFSRLSLGWGELSVY